MKEILLTLREKNQLQKEMGCARSTLLMALKGSRDTTLIRLIRKQAEIIVFERNRITNTESHA
ncbi:MAG: hypothetical protein ACRC77_05355 [Bacteroidales bacterium]